MSVRDIQELLSDMYGMEISPSLISKLTERILPRIEEWQSRPLECIYVILFVDCIFYKVRVALVKKSVSLLITEPLLKQDIKKMFNLSNNGYFPPPPARVKLLENKS